MTVRWVRGARWAALMDHLAEALTEAGADPFQKLRVVVSTRATGRVVGQEVAARLGISAGIAYVSPTALMRHLADAAGVGRDFSRWHGTPLDLAVAAALEESSHPLVTRVLSAEQSRPGRRRATALRVARLLRSYFDHAPELLAQWLEGSEAGIGGETLSAELSWQPELFRSVSRSLELDPLATLEGICGAALHDGTPTFVVAVDHLTQPQLRAVHAMAKGSGLTVLQRTGAPGEEWAAPLATDTHELTAESAPPPQVSVHDSHGEARQVEVLRDELTRAFAVDPTLEPRDVVIVCPQPERYSRLLDAAFSPADALAHPGRTLRLQPSASSAGNPVLHLLVRILRLRSARATASEIVELLLSPPIAHRWRLADRRAVVELVSGAGIRWGLDAQHRAAFDLADVQQNTWTRGIDRLLIGLTVAPGQDVGLGLSGAEAVTASDLGLVGSLSEVLTRLRHAVAATGASGTVEEWAQRVRSVIASLVGLPYEDQWQELHALSTVAGFAADHQGSPTTLTPHEFAHLLEESAQPPRTRVAAGNGALQVIPLAELQHVEFRVVAMVGVTDDVVPGRGGRLPDSVAPEALIPNLPQRRLQQLITHARNCEQLILIRQAGSQRTNDPSATPVAVSWLLDQLGAAHTDAVPHPPVATSLANFQASPSFDAAAYSGAKTRASRRPHEQTLTARRRQEARSRPRGPAPAQVTLAQLEKFLTDPAKAFLRGAGNVVLYDEPSVADEMPLEVGGLDNWRLVNALVESWKQRTSLESVESNFRQREDLPPRAIGDAAFKACKQDATLLWLAASEDWFGESATHAIDLTVDLAPGVQVRVVDEVRTRNGRAVAANPSRSQTGILRPWLESLAVAAQGVNAPAVLHYFERTRETNFQTAPAYWEVEPLTSPRSLKHLTRVVDAFVQAQHRLITVPVGPGLEYARAHANGTFNPTEWAGPIGDFRGKWAGVGPGWRLFYADDVRELFADGLLPGDPDNGHATPFQAWSWELYAPLTGGAE